MFGWTRRGRRGHPSWVCPDQKRTSLNQWIIWEASALNVSGAVRLVGTGPGTLGRPRLTSMGRDVGF